MRGEEREMEERRVSGGRIREVVVSVCCDIG